MHATAEASALKQTVNRKASREMAEDEETKVEDSAPENFGGLRISTIKIGGLLLIIACCLFLFLLNAALSWWALPLLAAPVYLLLEWLGKKVFAEKYGWSTAQAGFSLTRIIFGVVLLASILGLIFILWRWTH